MRRRTGPLADPPHETRPERATGPAPHSVEMDLARVVGRVVCTLKNEPLRGTKLLIVQPLDLEGRPRGAPLVALDAVGAGAGETVFYVTGREASFAFLPDVVPTDASIVGIVDSVTLREDAPSPVGEVAEGGESR